MNALFDQLTLADIHQDLLRNIVSLRQSQDVFDDLSDDPAERLQAQRVEFEIKPPPYRSGTPIIHRPFEDAAWFSAIVWPFKNWQASRYSDGAYGVWYGSDSIETTVFETAYHWSRGLLGDAGFDREPVIAERNVWSVACNAALLDLRQSARVHPDLLHRSDYAFCQSVGKRIHREGHPGLLTHSVRRPAGVSMAIFNPGVLSNPRYNCQVTYTLDGGQIIVEKQQGAAWMILNVADFL
jgi:hypothetical protein